MSPMSDKGEGLVERRVEVITNALLHLLIPRKELEFAARQVELALRPLDADRITALEAEVQIAESNRDAARQNFLTMQRAAAALLARAELAERNAAELQHHIGQIGRFHDEATLFSGEQKP